MERPIKTLLYISIVYLLTYASTSYSKSEAAPEHTLARGHGYLLMHIDAPGLSPSIEYAKKVAKKRYTLPRTLDLGKYQNKYVLIQLPKGVYSITKINAPYFNLPYILNTKGDEDWMFTVKEGHTNYIGHLILNKKRSKDSLEVLMLNRFSKSLEEINTKYELVLNQYPLTIGSIKKDAFYSHYLDEWNENK